MTRLRTLALLISVVLAAPAALAQDACPAAPEIEPEAAPLLNALRDSTSEGTAREISAQLWALWTRAPDEHAQHLLDEGMTRRASFDFAGAMIAFDALVSYCPAYAEGYNQRAFVSFLRHDFQDALIDLDKTLDLSPRHIGALSGKALTLMGLGQMDEAQVVLRDALALNPWLPERGLLVGPLGEDI
ncbi:MAG: hypothetical protein AAF667_00700 [Pseudomonadota bacterium]